MTGYNIFKTIREAYETSTRTNNRFLTSLCTTCEWDNAFYADCEYHFVYGDMTITTPSTDPFNMDWKPCVMFGDGSVIEF